MSLHDLIIFIARLFGVADTLFCDADCRTVVCFWANWWCLW